MSQVPVKIVRHRTNEGTQFDQNTPRMSITVPQSTGFADLSQSQVVFRMNMRVQNVVGEDVLYPVAFGHVNAENEVDEAASAGVLIRNSRAQSRNGYNTELRRNNVVNENLDWYLSSSEDKSSSSGFKGLTNRNFGRKQVTWADGVEKAVLPYTPFLDYSQPTAITDEWNTGLSKAHDGEVYIPMKNIDRMADNATQFPYVATGDTDYHIELENVSKVVGLFNAAQLPGVDMPCQNCEAANTNNFGEVLNPIQITGTYSAESLAQLPLYVGAPIRVTYTEAAVPNELFSTVTALRVNQADGRLQITINNPLPGSIDRTAVGVNIAHKFPTDGNAGPHTIAADVDKTSHTVTWSVDEAFLQVHKLVVADQALEKAMQQMKDMTIPFMDYKLIVKSLPAGNQISDSLELDQNVAGLAVITPRQGHYASGNDAVKEYRFAIDGIETTNREIGCGLMDRQPRALHNYLLKQFFANQGKKLVKYDMPNIDFLLDDDHNTHAIYPCVTPLVPRNQVINMRLQCDDGDEAQQKDYFYVQVKARAMMIKDGRVMMA